MKRIIRNVVIVNACCESIQLNSCNVLISGSSLSQVASTYLLDFEISTYLQHKMNLGGEGNCKFLNNILFVSCSCTSQEFTVIFTSLTLYRNQTKVKSNPNGKNRNYTSKETV